MHSLFKRAPKGALAVLGFHNITPTFSQPHLSAAFPRRFRRLCDLVRSCHEVVTVSEGVRRLAEGTAPRDRSMVAFIFDDGYADTCHTVMPIMKSLGLVGTSYVVISALEEGLLPWYEELGRLIYRMPGGSLSFDLGGESFSFDIPAAVKARDDVFWQITRTMKKHFDDSTPQLVSALQEEHGIVRDDKEARDMLMTPEDARSLLQAGFEVGCHSWTHPILPTLDDASLDREIITSRGHLEGLLDHEVTSFCYPNGDNDQRCVDRAAGAGYSCAVSMTCGANLPHNFLRYQLKRAAISEDITWIWPFKSLYHIHAALVDEPS